MVWNGFLQHYIAELTFSKNGESIIEQRKYYYLRIDLSIYLITSPNLSTYFIISLCVWLSVYLCVYSLFQLIIICNILLVFIIYRPNKYVYVYVYLSVCLSVYLFFFKLVYLSVYLFVCVSFNLSICISN